MSLHIAMHLQVEQLHIPAHFLSRKDTSHNYCSPHLHCSGAIPRHGAFFEDSRGWSLPIRLYGDSDKSKEPCSLASHGVPAARANALGAGGMDSM
jgi:hypothetical protein